jgi:hypothetical protein
MLLLAAQASDTTTLLDQVEQIDFRVLADVLRRRRLLGLLGQRLISAAGSRIPSEFSDAVQEIIAEGRRRAEVQQMATWGILGALAGAGVAAMPVKGAFFGEWLHGDAGLRLSEDIDILVSPEQMPEALRVFEELGYLRPPKHDQLPPRIHHVLRSATGLPTVELHWRLHWYETRFASDALARSAVVGGALRRAAPMDELMALLLVYARDGFVGLRIPVDIGAWWSANGHQISRRSWVEALDGYPELARAVGAAAFGVSQLLGLSLAESLPCEVIEQRRTQIALRFADRAGLNVGRPGDQAAVVDGLLAPIACVPAFVERQFWPILPGEPSLLDRVLHAGALGLRSASLLWSVRKPGRSTVGDRV